MQHPHAAENYCRTFTPVNKLYFLRRASPRGKQSEHQTINDTRNTIKDFFVHADSACNYGGYHWMMKRVSMNEWIMPVLIYAQNTMLNLKLTIPGLRAERKVISKLSPRSYLKRSLIPIKKIETKIDSVECISIHRVDS